ncbi:hypothetical protein V6N11_018432 [Hibiscus sabdariffa]|uniref:Uncharacterized protein n=1 Tax=Hibiscus sabdariffa TaxID=183260 RepID=A0ABR2T872_9ROSI
MGQGQGGQGSAPCQARGQGRGGGGVSHQNVATRAIEGKRGSPLKGESKSHKKGLRDQPTKVQPTMPEFQPWQKGHGCETAASQHKGTGSCETETGHTVRPRSAGGSRTNTMPNTKGTTLDCSIKGHQWHKTLKTYRKARSLRDKGLDKHHNGDRQAFNPRKGWKVEKQRRRRKEVRRQESERELRENRESTVTPLEVFF